MKPLIKAVADEVLAPIYNKAVKPTGTAIAKGLWRASKTELGGPGLMAIARNTPNNMPGYYGGPVPRAKALVVAGTKSTASTIYEQMNPFARKLSKDTGISPMDQRVAKKTIKLIDTPKAQETQAILKQRTALKKNITRATNQGNEEKAVALNQQLDSIPEPSKAEREALKEQGKIAQGQMSQALIRNEMTGVDSPLLRDKFKNENYLGIVPWTQENFSSLSKERYWETENIPNIDGMMDTAFKRINEAWGDISTDAPMMFIKKTNSSDASANLANEINMNAKINNRIRSIFKARGKPFESLEEMKSFIEAELKNNKKLWIKSPKRSDKGKKVPVATNFEIVDNALWFGDSYLSAAKELGGVNTQHGVLTDGTTLSIMSDVQDLFKMKQPGGEDGISVSLPMITNHITSGDKKKVMSPVENAYEKRMDEAKKERAGLFNTQEESFSGMSPNQVALIREIAELKPDNLSLEEWVAYFSKQGIAGGVGYNVLNSSQER